MIRNTARGAIVCLTLIAAILLFSCGGDGGSGLGYDPTQGKFLLANS